MTDKIGNIENRVLVGKVIGKILRTNLHKKVRRKMFVLQRTQEGLAQALDTKGNISIKVIRERGKILRETTGAVIGKPKL